MGRGRDVAGDVVAVAGATGALGSRIASLLADRGATVVGLARDRGRLEAITSLADHEVLDLADPRSPGAALEGVMARHDRLDGLVNAAGVVAFGNLAEVDDETLDRLFAVNALGPLRLVRAALPHLAAGDGGFVANLSAVVAEQPMGGLASYSASKAALTAASTALAREVRRDGVHVLDVRPPHTETGLADRPIAGEPPRLPTGLDPDAVAARIVTAIVEGERDLPADAFA